MKPWVLFSALHEVGVVAEVCSHGMSEAEAGWSEIQENPHLHKEFKANLCYIRPCLKQKDKKNWEKREGEGEEMLANTI